MVLFSDVVTFVNCQEIVKIDPKSIPNIFTVVTAESMSNLKVFYEPLVDTGRLLMKPAMTLASLMYKSSFEDVD